MSLAQTLAINQWFCALGGNLEKAASVYPEDLEKLRDMLAAIAPPAAPAGILPLPGQDPSGTLQELHLQLWNSIVAFLPPHSVEMTRRGVLAIYGVKLP